MDKKCLLGIGLMVSLWTYSPIYAQEEKSAEVYLEEYTDEFQENFFEALKQKGIQNFDRAIALFLKCKRLEPTYSVIDYELAKAYYSDKQYIKAQDFALQALNAEPTDFWYLENVLKILDAQGNTLDAIKQNIPFDNQKLQENLALAYFKRKKHQEALIIIMGLDNQSFAAQIKRKIDDSLQQKNVIVEPTTPSIKENQLEDDNPVADYQNRIKNLLERNEHEALLAISKEALDAYPLQPFFYYAYGAALNGTSNANKAIEVLEDGLDYLVDNDALANNMYRELSRAYTQIGNTTKANEYTNKIKPGL
ncbi:hypothetical protein GTQ34_06705 [Muricauda sp. JGD-17]|uniref:Tetratricopeptide repeat protein n=1 Tax=Flagellimonas ochracea TaxID=2696472 RepID=A0A964WWZ6_9FLAO|nr:hypothetical protein [Allomuricauda ochracea]NAY91601.1 hypothetical protein [Allomuricauda ochracea]